MRPAGREFETPALEHDCLPCYMQPRYSFTKVISEQGYFGI